MTWVARSSRFADHLHGISEAWVVVVVVVGAAAAALEVVFDAAAAALAAEVFLS
jgi:hypothetical protein